MPTKKTTTTKKVEKAPKAKAEKKVTATKKVTEKKPAAKKPATKKAAVKKTTTKKVAKESKQKYIDVINWKKGEANGAGWLYIEVNAGDLNTEVEAGVDNLKTICEAIKDCMLEGDEFLELPKKASASLTVRYYTDNLSEDRRKYSEAE